MSKRKLLNVGGDNKDIPLPAELYALDHVLLDVNPRSEADLVHDARKLTDLEPNQFDVVYCSHNLEHFYPHEGSRVLEASDLFSSSKNCLFLGSTIKGKVYGSLRSHAFQRTN